MFGWSGVYTHRTSSHPRVSAARKCQQAPDGANRASHLFCPAIAAALCCRVISISTASGGKEMNINRTTLNALVFAVGLVLGMLGYVGHLYSSAIATVLLIGTWFIGYALVNLFVKPDK
jgi:hypothetical protein